ncbi:MAG: hypothetical protein AB1511_15435, partial [Deinococcota bacterium]
DLIRPTDQQALRDVKRILPLSTPGKQKKASRRTQDRENALLDALESPFAKPSTGFNSSKKELLLLHPDDIFGGSLQTLFLAYQGHAGPALEQYRRV